MQNQQIIEAVNKVATSLKTSEILKELGNATWDKDKLTNLLHESKAAYDQATSNEDFKNISELLHASTIYHTLDFARLLSIFSQMSANSNNNSRQIYLSNSTILNFYIFLTILATFNQAIPKLLSE